ncbi:hypothetical protein KM043_009751 [Ampulex compressa]|nr:hypothetical protein KM043_009751 [Ampulex compressa]
MRTSSCSLPISTPTQLVSQPPSSHWTMLLRCVKTTYREYKIKGYTVTALRILQGRIYAVISSSLKRSSPLDI